MAERQKDLQTRLVIFGCLLFEVSTLTESKNSVSKQVYFFLKVRPFVSNWNSNHETLQ